MKNYLSLANWILKLMKVMYPAGLARVKNDGKCQVLARSGAPGALPPRWPACELVRPLWNAVGLDLLAPNTGLLWAAVAPLQSMYPARAIDANQLCKDRNNRKANECAENRFWRYIHSCPVMGQETQDVPFGWTENEMAYLPFS